MPTNLEKIKTLTLEKIATICDHTFLNRSEGFRQSGRPGDSAVTLREQAFRNFIEATCTMPHPPYAICVRAEDVRWAKRLLAKYKTHLVIAATVGFPDGSWYSTDFKIAEAQLALDAGATEIDMVFNYALFKEGNMQAASKDVQEVVKIVHKANAIIKLILETSELTQDQIAAACKLATSCGIDFVKTSTGFSAHGATEENLRIMRANFQGGIKISGGVNMKNIHPLLTAAAGDKDGMIVLDPKKIRIGESTLLSSSETTRY